MHDVFVASERVAGPPAVEGRGPEEVRAWIGSLLDRPGELWLALTGDDQCSASCSCAAPGSNLLFVAPRPAGAAGSGAALLDLAKALRPQGFGLRVFQANTRARDFYRRHGLVELETTDGSSYDDDEPDLQMAWLGEDPLAYLRGRIDAVDDELAVLLARRVALTAAVQDHKAAVGARGAGRDADREAEIVERMSGPRPGPRRRTGSPRVMHTVIAESLAAWEDASAASGVTSTGSVGRPVSLSGAVGC